MHFLLQIERNLFWWLGLNNVAILSKDRLVKLPKRVVGLGFLGVVASNP